MRFHLALIGLIAAIHLWPHSRPDLGLLQAPAAASPYQLHVLANSPTARPDSFSEEFRLALAAAPSPLREWLYSSSLAAFELPRRELRMLLDAWDPKATGAVPAEEWLAFPFQFRKPGGFRGGAAGGMERVELLWTLLAMDGQPVPAEARTVMKPVLGAVASFLGPDPQGSGRRKR